MHCLYSSDQDRGQLHVILRQTNYKYKVIIQLLCRCFIVGTTAHTAACCTTTFWAMLFHSYGMHLYPTEKAHYTRPYAAEVPTGTVLPSNSALQEMKESVLALSLINSAWLHQYPSELVCFSLHRWALCSHSQQQHTHTDKSVHLSPEVRRNCMICKWSYKMISCMNYKYNCI